MSKAGPGLSHQIMSLPWRLTARGAISFYTRPTTEQGSSYSPAGGHIEPGEEPLVAAKRELLEETGYRAATWKFLGCFRTDLNRGNGMGWYYLATGAEMVRTAEDDDLEEHTLELLEKKKLVELLRSNQVKEITSQAAFLMALADRDDK